MQVFETAPMPGRSPWHGTCFEHPPIALLPLGLNSMYNCNYLPGWPAAMGWLESASLSTLCRASAQACGGRL